MTYLFSRRIKARALAALVTSVTSLACVTASQAGPGVRTGLNCRGFHIQGCFVTTHGKSRATDWIVFHKDGLVRMKTCNRRTGKCRMSSVTMKCIPGSPSFWAEYQATKYSQYYTFVGRNYDNKFARKVKWHIQTRWRNRKKPMTTVSSTFVLNEADNACR